MKGLQASAYPQAKCSEGRQGQRVNRKEQKMPEEVNTSVSSSDLRAWRT